jgi:hypothetical protein
MAERGGEKEEEGGERHPLLMAGMVCVAERVELATRDACVEKEPHPCQLCDLRQVPAVLGDSVTCYKIAQLCHASVAHACNPIWEAEIGGSQFEASLDK